MVKRSVLTQQNVFKFADWLRSEQESLNRLKPTRKQAAQMATEALGFRVTEHNVKGLVQTLGLEISFRLRENGARNKTISTLRNALINLYNKVGEPIPADL